MLGTLITRRSDACHFITEVVKETVTPQNQIDLTLLRNAKSHVRQRFFKLMFASSHLLLYHHSIDT